MGRAEARRPGRGWRVGAAALGIGVGATALARHRYEQRQVRQGRRPPMWAATATVPPARQGRLAEAAAQWDPRPPQGRTGHALAVLWAAPTTLAGLAVCLLSATRPRWEPALGCLVATDARGLARWAGADAQGLGHLIVTRRATLPPALLAHELVHVRQAETLGPLMLPVYIVWMARYGYRNHPLERGARSATRAASQRRPPASR